MITFSFPTSKIRVYTNKRFNNGQNYDTNVRFASKDVINNEDY